MHVCAGGGGSEVGSNGEGYGRWGGVCEGWWEQAQDRPGRCPRIVLEALLTKIVMPSCLLQSYTIPTFERVSM